MSRDIEGIEFPPRDGAAGKCGPTEAEAWLDAWAMIGGGITITSTGRVNPWRFISPSLSAGGREVEAQKQTALLAELDTIPGLAAAVRILIGAKARRMAHRSRTPNRRNDDDSSK